MDSRTVARVFLVCFTFPSCMIGLGQGLQQPVSASAQGPATSRVPFAVAIKKAVVFFETDCLQDGKVVPYLATAFVVVKPDERLGKDRGFQYLVTNRHAVQPGIEGGAPCQVTNYAIKVNLRSNDSAGSTSATLISLGPNLPWLSRQIRLSIWLSCRLEQTDQR